MLYIDTSHAVHRYSLHKQHSFQIVQFYAIANIREIKVHLSTYQQFSQLANQKPYQLQ